MPDQSVHVDVTVRRRHVLFVPGYDPFPARRYRELYRSEGAKQAEICGYELAQTRAGQSSWDVTAKMDGVITNTRIEVLGWQDLVRGRLHRSLFGNLRDLCVTFWTYARSGALWRLFRLRPHPMIAAAYPVLVLFGQLLIALALTFAMGRVASEYGLPFWSGALLGGGLAMLGAELLRRYDRHVFAHYLVTDFTFGAIERGAYTAPLDARISEFSNEIQKIAHSDYDEILIVGHSSGAQLAVSALARTLPELPQSSPVISLLTLGQVIPMISFLPRANALRRDLNRLSASARIAWVDVTAPGDGGCFALSDPVHVSGVAPPEPQKHWPKVISAAFSLSLSPEFLHKTRYRFFRRHVQYLCAFDRVRDYDYFAITSGPRTLEDRFAWRGASAARIETVLSGYKDM